MSQKLGDLGPLAARAALEQSDRDIARLLGEHTGVAFVGSAQIDARARTQFSRYGGIPIFIVNPRGGGEVEGIPIVRSVLDLPDVVDLVVVRTAPKWVGQVVRECGERGIRDILIFTDGYAETGDEGAALESELAQIARQAGVRLVGPNTNDNAFELYPQPLNHRGGKIAMITQSGANGRSIVEGVQIGASFHRWVTTGNEVDLEVADFIHHFAGLDDVAVIALYVEGFKSPAKLRLALDRAIRSGKPVVAIKMGATRSGELAAKSHTGHLTGADDVMNGLFRQYGVIRVSDVDELLETANLLSKIPPTTGSNCVMYTISGGTAALMAEAAEAAGLEIPKLTPELQEKLHEYIPINVNVSNPIDNGGVFIMSNDQGQRLAVLDLALSDTRVDMMLFGFNAAYGPLSDRMGADVLVWAPQADKPSIAVWASTITDTQGFRDLVNSGVPIFRSFGKCMRALAARQNWMSRRTDYEREESISPPVLPDRARVALSHRGVLSTAEAAALLQSCDIAFARERIAHTPEEAANVAAELGWPVALKLVSPQFPHKSDLGFVKLGLRDTDSVRSEAAKMLSRVYALAPDATVEGLQVQEQIESGVELLVGISQDAVFGPSITIGMGGIYAEVLCDTIAAPLPVTERDVRSMIASLRMAPLLDGVRGAPPADLSSVVALIMAVARLGEAAGGSLVELDLNPVMALSDRAVAVDALVVAGGPRPDAGIPSSTDQTGGSGILGISA